MRDLDNIAGRIMERRKKVGKLGEHDQAVGSGSTHSASHCITKIEISLPIAAACIFSRMTVTTVKV